MECGCKTILASLILGLCLLFGLWGLGSNLSKSNLKQIKMDKTISIKGISEKEVYADKAIYPISYIIRGYELDKVAQKMDNDTNLIINLLKENGFSDSEIFISQPRLSYDKENIPEDRMALRSNLALKNSMEMAGSYGDMNVQSSMPQNESNRELTQEELTALVKKLEEEKKVDTPLYILSKKVTIKSDQVDKIIALTGKLDSLIHGGVNVYGQSNVEYIFSKINEIKDKMYAEATQNGLNLAKELAEASNSTLGGAKRINQGQASVYDDSFEPNKKKIIVENYLEFYLDN